MLMTAGACASAGVCTDIDSGPCSILAATRAAVYLIALSMIARGIRKVSMVYTAQLQLEVRFATMLRT